MKGLLDDAYELAVKLHMTLVDADALAEEAERRRTAGQLANLADEADDLANQIDRQRTALRGS